jgi:hypothetical protein
LVGRWVAKSVGRWLAKLVGRWVAKLVGRWVAKLVGRWVAKLIPRLLPTAARWVQIQTSPKKYKIGEISKGVANTL